MEEWFRGYGVDGFLFHPSHLPGRLDDFVAVVIPELQSRGLFRAFSPRVKPGHGEIENAQGVA